MKNILISTILLSILLIFCSSKKNINEHLTQKEFEISSDTVIMIFQNFQNQVLVPEFDTVIVIITHELNKTTIKRELNSDGYEDFNIIYKSGNQYLIERESVNSKCSVRTIESEYHNLGNLLIGSCWSESHGMPVLDSGVGIIFSSFYGKILHKGFQINAGQVIFSIDGDTIPITQRQELIEK